jgi:hypothetical protein
VNDLPTYIWLALAASGIWLARLNGLEALKDYQALGGHVNGRRTIAVGNIRREIVRGLIQVDFVILGLLALLDVLSGVVFVSGLLLASVGMQVNSYLDRRDRLYLTANGIQARDEQGRFTSEK